VHAESALRTASAVFSFLRRLFRPRPYREIRRQPHDPRHRIQHNRKNDHRRHKSVLKQTPRHARIRQHQHSPEPDGEDDETQCDVEQHPTDVVIAFLTALECNSALWTMLSQVKPVLQYRPTTAVGTSEDQRSADHSSNGAKPRPGQSFRLSHL
jgi:hypothetical protein